MNITLICIYKWACLLCKIVFIFKNVTHQMTIQYGRKVQIWEKTLNMLTLLPSHYTCKYPISGLWSLLWTFSKKRKRKLLFSIISSAYGWTENQCYFYSLWPSGFVKKKLSQKLYICNLLQCQVIVSDVKIESPVEKLEC